MFSPRPKLSNDEPINHQIEFIYWLEVIISYLVIGLILRLELFCTHIKDPAKTVRATHTAKYVQRTNHESC